MNDMQQKLDELRARIGGGLIVSCQAPADSPLARPAVIAALAESAENNGARAVRINTPEHVAAVRRAVAVPIIGIYKIVAPPSEVYITPTFEAAAAIAAAGADIIAIDATPRCRPGDERLAALRERIARELALPVMADVSTFDEGVFAAETLGCEFVGTTLSGYTEATRGRSARPDFELLERLAARISAPVIAEGRIGSPAELAEAFRCGAFAAVVGNAITGIDEKIKSFAAAVDR